MSKLYLYSIFHGNLNYSSIPSEMYEKIIDTCYWPLLDLTKQYNFVTGVEFPFNTIKKIQSIDPLFIDELKKLVKQKKCEIICSSQEQVVLPLCPEKLNIQNLKLGKINTENLFKTKVSTVFVNEQLFSPGSAQLYKNEGFDNIITIWEWANKISNLKHIKKFSPAKFPTKKGSLNILWNSYIAFQKFQRYINGEISTKNFFEYIKLQKNSKIDSCFPFYGSDMEIFGYKNPVLGINGDGEELKRFKKILEQIEKNKDIEFTLPKNILKKFPIDENITFDSANGSILGKKQEKFSVSRWAVCGRDNSKSNSLCYDSFKKINILNSLSNVKNNYMNELIDCWASDFRTHTTESKYSDFHRQIGVLSNKLDDEILSKSKRMIKSFSDELVVYNPNKIDWENIPFEIKLLFKPNTFKNNFDVYVNNKKIPSQLEDKIYYKNKSLRSVTLVIEPFIKKKSKIDVTLKENSKSENIKLIQTNTVKTKQVELTVSSDKGASISDLKFTKIDKKPLIGVLEHGTFEDPKMSADFFSGHTISFDRNGNKFTDLKKIDIFSEKKSTLIRKKLWCTFELPFGDITKIYYVYEKTSRVDIKYIYNFKNYRPSSFRTGILTLIPSSFDKTMLRYSTHNGSSLESFNVNTEKISHDESIDPRFSSSGCLGATENMIDFGDDKKGITIFSDKSKCYSVPMINFREFENSFFFRITNSLSEMDDTTMTSWKGRKEISFTLLGRNENELDKNLKLCQVMSLGLICLSSNPNISVIS